MGCAHSPWLSTFRASPRSQDHDYARADVYWQLPSGEIILQLGNVSALSSPRGCFLLKATRR